MKTIQEQIEVMQHYANGGEIEIFMNDEWKYAISPGWNWNHCNYRIKEQKETITIEKWLCEYNRCELLEGSKRFFILEKAVPFEFGNGKKVKLLKTYEVEL
ncbi:MAG: hypothetical protein ACEQSQ_11735 [Candidatus Paceibacteria bacterium]